MSYFRLQSFFPSAAAYQSNHSRRSPKVPDSNLSKILECSFRADVLSHYRVVRKHIRRHIKFVK